MSGRGSNFDFLSTYDAQLVRLRALTERYFKLGPNTYLIKLRQLAGLLTQQLVARMGLFASSDEAFADLPQRLKTKRAMPHQAGDLFYQLRIAGNQAAYASRKPWLLWLLRSWRGRAAIEACSTGSLLPKLDPAILAQAFRGELVPQDPNDEPASTLLERIKVDGRVNGSAPRCRRKV